MVVNRIEVKVAAGNDAIRLYEKYGFVKLGGAILLVAGMDVLLRYYG